MKPFLLVLTCFILSSSILAGRKVDVRGYVDSGFKFEFKNSLFSDSIIKPLKQVWAKPKHYGSSLKLSLKERPDIYIDESVNLLLLNTPKGGTAVLGFMAGPGKENGFRNFLLAVDRTALLVQRFNHEFLPVYDSLNALKCQVKLKKAF